MTSPIDIDRATEVSMTFDLGSFYIREGVAQLLAWALGSPVYPSCLAPGYVLTRLAFRNFNGAPPPPAAPNAFAQASPGPFADLTVARVKPTEESTP